MISVTYWYVGSSVQMILKYLLEYEESALQDDLNLQAGWGKTNKLDLNVEKCSYLTE